MILKHKTSLLHMKRSLKNSKSSFTCYFATLNYRNICMYTYYEWLNHLFSINYKSTQVTVHVNSQIKTQNADYQCFFVVICYKGP